MINNYLNSIKIRKEENKEEGMLKRKKTMKEIIEEAMLEKLKQSEMRQKILDWEAIDYVVPRKIKEK